MMDTPEKEQIGTLISKVEDSPVFNYINSLSPIKPVNSRPTTQTFNSLSFTSPPSAFTSPNICSHKETRFFKRNHFTDPSKPEFSDCGNEDNTSEGISGAVQLSDLCTEQLRCLSPENSATEVTTETHNEHSELAIELPQSLKYDCGSPSDNNALSCDVIKTVIVPEMAGTPASLIQFAKDGSKERHCSLESKRELGQNFQIEQNKEAVGCDWDKLISDAADLLTFDSSIIEERSEGQDHKTVDSGMTHCISTLLRHPQDNINDLQRTQLVGPAGSCEQHDMEMHVTQSGEVPKLKKTDQEPDFLSCIFLNKQSISDSNTEVDDKEAKNTHFSHKPGFQQQRSIRRLVFEMSGAHIKRSIYNNSSSSSVSLQSECKVAFNEKQMVSVKAENGYSSSMLPGIGLHLNALASTSNNASVVMHEALDGGRQLSMSSSNSSFDPLISGQKPLNISLNQNSIERDLVPCDNEVQVMEDATSSFGVSEEFIQGSPKRKRRRSENAGESEACKRCNCKKSKCLKLYCECFAAGLYCVEPCSCQDCFNKPIHEDTVMETRKQIESRNPLAFAPKVIRNSESVPEFGDESNKTPASARHKRGCNCKKSSCLKKYCECFQGGVGCSISCRCEGCKNTFGRKDGECLTGPEETELECKETEAHEKNISDISSQNNVVQKGEEEHSDLVLPIMPLSEIGRPLVQLPFSFSGKPLQSSLLAVGSSPQLCTSQRLEKSDSLWHLPKFEKRLQMIPEDETPEILKGNCSPTRGVKAASPNCKRVSPPHRKFGSSPAWRSGRKLILRSIPSFPSLTPQQENSDFSGKPN